MTAQVEVQCQSSGEPCEFAVVVRDGRSETRHRVTMSTETYQRLSGKHQSPEACIEAAFRFLLDREPKESVLSRFDVTVISRYFPDFEREFPKYLSPSTDAPAGRG